jgi:uncharacterized protein (TIGR01370 family)
MSGIFLAMLLATVRWAAYYSGAEPAGGLSEFHLLILDSDSHPALAPLSNGRTLLGYISIGEVENTRAHFNLAKAKGILGGENENWKGSFFVDVRNPWWTEQVKALTRQVLQQGFHGVFLDTADDAEYLEDKDNRAYRGMQDAMARLVLDVRREFPKIPIALNRGYSLLPKIGSSIDYLLGESVRADYDFDAKTYRRAPQKDYAEQVRILKNAKQLNPKLTILTLDYWNPRDAAGIARIYNEQRANGFAPYVSTIGLNEIIREPAH